MARSADITRWRPTTHCLLCAAHGFTAFPLAVQAGYRSRTTGIECATGAARETRLELMARACAVHGRHLAGYARRSGRSVGPTRKHSAASRRAFPASIPPTFLALCLRPWQGPTNWKTPWTRWRKPSTGRKVRANNGSRQPAAPEGRTTLATRGFAPAAAVTACFKRSIALAQEQGALSWELRSATSLARLLFDTWNAQEAHRLLAPVYGRFTEGHQSVDLVAARTLLERSAVRPDRSVAR